GEGGGLDEHQRHPAGRPAAQVDKVPVVREPVPGDVLTHGGHHDPVAKRHPADRERAEEVDLGHLTVVVGTGRAAVGCGFLRVIGTVIGHNPVSMGAFISGWMSGMRASGLARAGTRCPGYATWAAQIEPTLWEAMSRLPGSSTSRGPCTSGLR